jgi:uncharacterized protein YbbC (DUF1343 family)
MSVGRGTPFPFQVIGYPDSTLGSFTFTPVSIPTKSKYPRFENQMCYGVDLRNQKPPSRVDLAYVIDFYQKFPVKDDYFISYFNKLAGTDKLMEQIVSGTSAEEIYDSWQSGLDSYQVLRKKYLLYPDFE